MDLKVVGYDPLEEAFYDSISDKTTPRNFYFTKGMDFSFLHEAKSKCKSQLIQRLKAWY